MTTNELHKRIKSVLELGGMVGFPEKWISWGETYVARITSVTDDSDYVVVGSEPGNPHPKPTKHTYVHDDIDKAISKFIQTVFRKENLAIALQLEGEPE